jgi:alpha-tubulin suppressor-like RCC1 family protein
MIDRWYTCIECIDGELDSAALLKDTAVSYLAYRLAGPPQERLERTLLRLGEYYVRIVEYAGPAGTPVTEDEYVRHYLENYIRTYQVRSAIALREIGTRKAHRVLRDALEWDTLYEADVRAAIREALASNLRIQAGDSQAAVVGATLPGRPAVRVHDERNRPVDGVPVTFEVASGGGVLTDPVILTDSLGIAAVGSWVLGPDTGTQSLRARTARDSVEFVARALASPSAVITASSGLVLESAIDLPLALPPSVRITNGSGQPVSGQIVTFTVVAGGGNVGGAPAASATTAGDGLATAAPWVLGPTVGVENRLVARAAGISGEVVFRARATRPPPDSFGVFAGDGQTALVGEAVATRPAVLVLDPLGRRLSGVTVAFSVTAGGGSVTDGIQDTDADGVAVVGSWILGPLPGLNRLRARVVGLPSVAFTATAITRPPDSLVALSGNGEVAPAGTDVAVPPVVLVLDRIDNPVPGVTVSFTVTSGGGTIANTNAVTGLDGTARIDAWRLGPTTGENTLAVSVQGLAPLEFRDTATMAFASVVAGWAHTCALGTDSLAYCWGRNTHGQLGTGDTLPVTVPTRVRDTLRFLSLAAGRRHTCGLQAGGAIHCWGANDHGQLGDGTTTRRTQPTRVVGGQSFGALAAGALHTCGLSTGGVFCWGSDSVGQLGNGPPRQNSSQPVPVPGLSRVGSVATGAGHTCATSSDITAVGLDSLYCWGDNARGQVGDGSAVGTDSPRAVRATVRHQNPSLGGRSSCALTEQHAAFCWGENTAGQLGSGNRVNRSVPDSVLTPIRFAGLTMGRSHTCGVSRVVVYCWGGNSLGQLGNGTLTGATRPVRVSGLRVSAVSAGAEHTCALSLRGEVYCWGRGDQGQLGNGSYAGSSRPVRVRHPL